MPSQIPSILFALPDTEKTDDFFRRVRALLWGVFEILLLLLAMAAVIGFAWTHVPPPRSTRQAGVLGEKMTRNNKAMRTECSERST